MKKYLKILALAFVVSVTAIVPAACSLGGYGNRQISEVTRHTVTFDSCGGGTVNSKRVADGGSVGEPKATRNGYRLVGWYEDSEYKIAFDFNTAIYDDLTLYAKWEKETDNNEGNSSENNPQVKTATVTFHFCGGNNIFGDDDDSCRIEFDKDEGLFIDVLSFRDGYTFKGWYYDPQYNRPYVMGTVLHDDYHFYAKWAEGESEVKMYLNLDGGNIDGSESIRYCAYLCGDMPSFSEIPVPKKEGYIFLYWYYKPIGNDNFDFWYCDDIDASGRPVFNGSAFNKQLATDVMLYAKWQKI